MARLQIEKIFKALANKKRLEIIRYLLKEKSASVTDIANEINISLKSTSKHLLLLYGAEFLERERKSGLTIYFPNDTMGKIEKELLALIRSAS